MYKRWSNVSEWSAEPLTERWRLLLDINRDGYFTISDIIDWAGFILFVPGDALIYLLLKYLPNWAIFLEISTSDYGGGHSFFLSVFGWCVTFIIVVLSIFMVFSFLKWWWEGFPVDDDDEWGHLRD
jgi:hypothetical protein